MTLKKSSDALASYNAYGRELRQRLYLGQWPTDDEAEHLVDLFEALSPDEQAVINLLASFHTSRRRLQ